MHPIGMSLYLASLALAQKNTALCARHMDDARNILRSNGESLNEILDISRLKSGFVNADHTTFDITALLDETVGRFHSLAEQRCVDVRMRRRSGSPLVVRSDRHLLGRVIANLVSNAIKYSDGSKPHAAILVGIVGFQNRVRLDIVDNGIGILREHWDQVFKPFIQLDNPERDQQKGLGLGLSIVSAIIPLLEGHQIEMNSTVGRGTRFSIVVPRSQSPHAVVEMEQSSAASANLAGSFIIYVEDNAHTRDATVALFESCLINHRIFASVDALKEGLREMERMPNIVITDYRLPDRYTAGDVITLVNNEWNSSIPTIVLTGEASDLSNEAWFTRGVRVLRKPLPPETLLQEISNLLPVPD